MHVLWQSWTTCSCMFSAPPGGEVRETNMEETGGGCGRPRGWKQPCSGPEDSKRSPWCVTLANSHYTSMICTHYWDKLRLNHQRTPSTQLISAPHLWHMESTVTAMPPPPHLNLCTTSHLCLKTEGISVSDPSMDCFSIVYYWK